MSGGIRKRDKMRETVGSVVATKKSKKDVQGCNGEMGMGSPYDGVVMGSSSNNQNGRWTMRMGVVDGAKRRKEVSKSAQVLRMRS